MASRYPTHALGIARMQSPTSVDEQPDNRD
jgi:hypothetical protein